MIIFLCDRHPAAQIAPSVTDPDRPRYLQWMLFLADTLYPAYNRFYHPERYTADPDGVEAVKQQAELTMIRQWQVIEDALAANGPWLLGDRFSACDIYAQMVSTWHDDPAALLGQFPRLRALAQGVMDRCACRKALDRHAFGTGLD